MRSRLPFLVFVLILASGFIAIPAHADDVMTYDMTGSFTLTGYNVCSGPCTETIDFSSLLTLTPIAGEPGNYQDATSSAVFSATGALGDFNGGFGFAPAGGLDYVAFELGPDEIDMYVKNVYDKTSYLPSVNPIGFGVAEFYTCASAACIADFFNSGCSGLGCIGAADGADATGGTMTLTAAVSEPSTLTLLLTGMFIVGLATAFGRSGVAHLFIARHLWLRRFGFLLPKDSHAIGMG
jgi:hypothetical protein